MDIINKYIKTKYPDLKTDARQKEYIGKRVMGYESVDALSALNITNSEYESWLKNEPFLQMDTDGMEDMRKDLCEKISKEYYNKAFYLVMQKDIQVLEASIKDADNMSNTDKQYLFKIQNRYDGRLLESLSPKKAKEAKITWNQFMIEVNKGQDTMQVVEVTPKLLEN